MTEPQDFSEALFFAKSWFANELETLVKELEVRSRVMTCPESAFAVSTVALIIERRADKIRAALCSEADRSAREAEKNLPTSWSRLTP